MITQLHEENEQNIKVKRQLKAGLENKSDESEISQAQIDDFQQ